MVGLPGTHCRRRIYLMRHAEVSYFDVAGKPLDPRNVPLTEAGHSQAEAAARLLADVHFDNAICSGLRRTEETARVVLRESNLQLRVDSRLREVKAGRLRELPAIDRNRLIGHAYDYADGPEQRFMGGERWIDVQERVIAAWRDLFVECTWLNLLLVAHDAVNRIILSHIVGASLGGLKSFEQDPACVNIIEVDVDAGRILRTYLRAVNVAPYDHVRIGNHFMVLEKVLMQYHPD